MILRIYNANTDELDFQRIGNYNNHKFGLLRCNDAFLMPFKTFNIPHLTTNTILDFELRRVSIYSNDITVLETTDLSTSLINVVSGSLYDYYYFEALTEQSNLVDGLYYMYIKDNSGNEFMSDLFCVSSPYYDTVGDFNSDFSNDFLN